jgi:hypothetical protein
MFSMILEAFKHHKETWTFDALQTRTSSSVIFYGSAIVTDERRSAGPWERTFSLGVVLGQHPSTIPFNRSTGLRLPCLQGVSFMALGEGRINQVLTMSLTICPLALGVTTSPTSSRIKRAVEKVL